MDSNPDRQITERDWLPGTETPRQHARPGCQGGFLPDCKITVIEKKQYFSEEINANARGWPSVGQQRWGDRERGTEGRTGGKTVSGTSCNKSKPCHAVPLH